MVQMWTERMNLGKKRKNVAVRKPMGIECLLGARRRVKHPSQIQDRQTLQQTPVGVTFKPILEI